VADISEVAAMTRKMNATSQAFCCSLHGGRRINAAALHPKISFRLCFRTSAIQRAGPAGDRREEMAADFMLLIDLAIYAMVIACAAALLHEEKGGLSSQRCCSSVRRTAGEIRGPHKQAANLGFQTDTPIRIKLVLAKQ
jgi:hypothetical protein